MLFTENKGQVGDASGKARPDVLFTAQGNGMKIFRTATAITYQFSTNIYPTGFEGHSRTEQDHLIQES